MNFVEVRKKENLNIKSMANSENAVKNILKEGLKIYGQGLSITKVEDKSDYLGSTSVETRSPSHRFSVGG